MVEHTLWEGSSCCCQSECFCQTKGLGNWQICCQVYKWGALYWLFRLHLTPTLSKALVNAAYSFSWALDLNEKYGLLEAWLSRQLSCVHCSSCCRYDLVAPTVGIVLMCHDIHDVVACSTLVLVGKNTFFGNPLETSLDRVTNLPKILSLRGHID